MKTVKDLINQKEQQLNSKLKNIEYIKVKEDCKENRIELTDTKLVVFQSPTFLNIHKHS